MNKKQYLKELSGYLSKLPANEYEDSMNYFEELFDEVGESGEQELMNKLGTPKEVADEILFDLSGDSSEKRQPKRDVNETKKSSKIGLIILLLILASPVLLLLGVTFIPVMLGLLFAVFSIGFAAVIIFIVFIIIIIKLFALGFVSIVLSPAGALFLIGAGLVGVAFVLLGFVVILALWRILKWFCSSVYSLFKK